ncbi:MAG: DinB family protein [Hamadaea sp.]|uniref:DinB family protein n=1 Tax=Hamadaea sp. TaxID=2024425 RepID=UPI0017D57730|nr:DinB family protein [Hamadaea sp.]NUR71750.1 DinB family protein [Hamadaea sp.]NUT19064.1 DinB family protein [Hamadaea sp.]
MADQRPPRLVTGERETLVQLLQFQRESMVRKVTGVSDEAARQSPVGSGTSLLWLLKHLTQTEYSWFRRRFAGEEVELPSEEVLPGDTVSSAVAAYQQSWLDVAPILEQGDLDAECGQPGPQPPSNLRWVLAHMLEETARHAGHADIIRELIDGSTGR